MIEDIFKTPIYFKKLTLDNKMMANYCLSLQGKDKGQILSNNGGWQSNNLNKNEPILDDLFNKIEQNVSLFNKKLGINGLGKVGNRWININGYKDSNNIHSHPGSIISGVYYIQTPKNCGDIAFINPASDHLLYNWSDITSKYNSYNSIDWWVPSLVGRLYLFPGWLKHCVKPNLNKKEKRISISFNTF